MKYRISDNTIELSLSELCTMACGSSPLGDGVRESLYEEQTLFPRDYRRNVALSGCVELDGVRYELAGVTDGVFCANGTWTVDVVRMADARELRIPRGEWKSYGQLLAFLLAEREQAKSVEVRTVLVGREGGVKTSAKKISRESLHGFVTTLLSLLTFYTKKLMERETDSRPSADGVPFPFPEIREGQEEMIRGAMTAIRREKRLFACAPTGIGKTMSALYPAVRAFGAGLCDKIFYLTAKTSTSLEAYHAAGKLFEAGAHLRTIVLASKESMCKRHGGCGKYCNSRDCEKLRNPMERTREAIGELLDKQNGFYPAVIREAAAKHNVCPHELALDLSELCDIIVCDYNYLWDPMVYLQRYFGEERRFGEYVFLIDEAHNLVDRARGMFTATLSALRLQEIFDAIPMKNHPLSPSMAKVLSAMEETREMCRENRQAQADGTTTGYYIGQERAAALDRAVLAFSEKAKAWLLANREDELYDIINELLREMQRYAAILARYDEKFITYIEETEGETKISLICLDPTEVVGERLDMARAAVLFSATLTPLTYFSDLLGGGKRATYLELASPYAAENLCVAAVDTISTRFEDRDKTYKKTATYIAAAVSAKKGNYMVYFPSYRYLEKVHEAFCKKYPDVCTIVQKRGMNLAEKEAFLASFPEDTGKMRIGFCVLGGSFSEGVDLPGSRLIGSIIVGVGLPGFSSERNIMRDYFQNRYENGFEYAYTYAGMNNVLQAAGRVIRREEDRGIVVLIDDRYGTPTYQKLFPKHWEHLKYAGNPSSLAEIVRKFWEHCK
ncbi:MAG: ATP-dependent DNA helicase [Ruminococcaceae bacterium]|nr:ATP-dependent DNA helicase [Oscillospiraceae bacterium]